MSRDKIQPIYNDDDLRVALKEIRELWGAKPGTEDGDKLEVLATLVEAYEDRCHPMPLPDPIEAIKLRLEQREIPLKVTSALFIKLFGSPSKASEVLNRHRALSLPMIRRIHKELDLPLEILVQEVKLKAPKAKAPAKNMNSALTGKAVAARGPKREPEPGGRKATPKETTNKAKAGKTYLVSPRTEQLARGGRSRKEDMPKAAHTGGDMPFKGVRKGDAAAFAPKTAKLAHKKRAKGVN